MDLQEKLKALESQLEEIRNMFFKVTGGIELTKALMKEEEEEKAKPKEPKEEPKKGK